MNSLSYQLGFSTLGIEVQRDDVKLHPDLRIWLPAGVDAHHYH
jgi:hypothetical protein